jgi:hypothetical protein
VDLDNNPQRQEISESVKAEKPFIDINKIHNKQAGKVPLIERDTTLKDFYTTYRPWETADSVQEIKTYLYDQTYSKEEKAKRFGDKHYYELQFSNKGGLVMPIILEWTFADGTTQIDRIPAEIWRKNENQFKKVFVKDKMVKAVRLDPYRETADIDESNNNWPVKQVPTRFQVFKANRVEVGPNPMQKAKKKVRP